MTEKDIKKSLSLKSHKNSGAKQSKTPAGSKNVTIQVRRKKIIKPDNSIKKSPENPVADKSKISNDALQIREKPNIKVEKNKLKTKIDNSISEQPLSKKS